MSCNGVGAGPVVATADLHHAGTNRGPVPTATRTEPMTNTDTTDAKHRWRRRIRAQRAELTVETHRTESEALASAWRTEVLVTLKAGQTVCAYVPVRDEPGSIRILTDTHAAGIRVLVPVTDEPGPLHWAEFTGEQTLQVARFGLREPSGPTLSPDAVSDAAVVVVPALAADRRGVRLGRGAGYYDRTLPLMSAETRLICLVRDDEFVEALPQDPHDVRVGAVLTPGGGVVRTDVHTDRV